MATTAMAFLAASVAIGYFTIAAVIAPRIKMPSAKRGLVLAIRGAAIAFFIGCGMTHVHIFIHTVGLGAPQPAEAHELVFHVLQAIGAWLFIAGAILRLELHIVPATRVALEAAVEEQRTLADHAQKLAEHDELTGLARRWRFDEEIERQVALAQRQGSAGALVLIDVDGLKSVNDTLGHQAGDRVLRHVSASIRSQLRASDLAARIGGDEFAVLLPDSDREQAAVVAQRLVEALRGTGASETIRTSISAGLAPIERGLSAAQIMSRADLALYDAKRAGGDRYAADALDPEAGLV